MEWRVHKWMGLVYNGEYYMVCVCSSVVEGWGLIEAFNRSVPLPAPLEEALRGVFEHNLVALRDINLEQRLMIQDRFEGRQTYSLVSDLLPQRRHDLRVKRLLNQLGQLLDSTLQIPATFRWVYLLSVALHLPLVILEEFLLVADLQVVRHGIRPL
jgi:hypothetical protein